MSEVQPAIGRLYQIIAHERTHFRDGNIEQATRTTTNSSCNINNE
jgi:hypothetical protein